MGFADAARRMGATLLAMLHTRLELAALEVEEEAQRFLRYALMGLLAVFLLLVALVLLAFFIVLLFWEEHRLAAVGVLALAFGGGAALIGLKIRKALARKPRFMASTVDELKKDMHAFHSSSGASHE